MYFMYLYCLGFVCIYLIVTSVLYLPLRPPHLGTTVLSRASNVNNVQTIYLCVNIVVIDLFAFTGSLQPLACRRARGEQRADKEVEEDQRGGSGKARGAQCQSHGAPAAPQSCLAVMTPAAAHRRRALKDVSMAALLCLDSWLSCGWSVSAVGWGAGCGGWGQGSLDPAMDVGAEQQV